MNAEQFHTISDLLKKRLQHPLTGEESAMLDRWIADAVENSALIEKLEHTSFIAKDLKLISEADASIYTKILDQLPELNVYAAETQSWSTVHRVHFLRRGFFRYAAAIILVLCVAAYFWLSHEKMSPAIVSANKTMQPVIAPGGDRAILTLANGEQIILDSTQGNIVQQQNLTVINGPGRLKYEGAGQATDYNTITTPRGGQYQIVLPDGSKVWLNAASAVRFPTAFAEKERIVEVTGEAYLEIEKNAKQSFIVKANGTEIQVLGTSFNVNAYTDEAAVRTTLLEGSVKVLIAGRAAILKPGQQAVISAFNQQQAAIKVMPHADLDQTLAWKNGLFNFNGADLHTVMRQLERWYDIRVQYKGSKSDILFQGEMYRNANLSDVLNVLKDIGVQFELDGKNLIVL